MVIQQSHLFFHTICTCHGRGVRPLIIPLVYSFITLCCSSSVLVVGTELTPSFHFTPHDCYIWQVYQAVAISLILTAVDIILILRGKSNEVFYSHLHSYSYCKSVYALYRGNVVMRLIVPSFFLIEIVGMVVGLSMSLPKITYDELCLVTNAPRTLIIYAYAFPFHILQSHPY
jgi:hypothetical protein